MKKLLSLFIVFVLLFSVTGCKDNTDKTADKGDATIVELGTPLKYLCDFVSTGDENVLKYIYPENIITVFDAKDTIYETADNHKELGMQCSAIVTDKERLSEEKLAEINNYIKQRYIDKDVLYEFIPATDAYLITASVSAILTIEGQVAADNGGLDMQKTVIKVGNNWYIGPNYLENGSLEYYIGDF